MNYFTNSFNDKPESSRDLTILIMSFISSFHIISVVIQEPSLFSGSAADAACVNPNGIKILLADGLITFFINGYPVFNNGRRSLPRNSPNCIILDN